MAARKKSKNTRKSAPAKRAIALRGLKWLFVLGIWGTIAIGAVCAWYAMELPKIIESPKLERHSAITILADDGSQVARYGELKGMTVEVKELPPHLISAVLATEDRRFYQHFGLDPVGVLRAMARNVVAGDVVQGGSTITQQLAKNLFLSPERTFKRKIQEAMLALWLEHELTKDEIMTAYLNRVYLGAGAYGVEAASETYFDKSARDLSLYESAMIAGLLKAPSRYSPQSNPTLASQRARTVLGAMQDAGYITEDDVKNQTLKAQALLKKPSKGKDARSERYFADYVISTLDDLIGSSERTLTIETTLDPTIQNAAEQALTRALEGAKDRKVTQGAIVVMDTNGAILAMVGGANYSASQFNRATQALRPSGSAFKPFVFLAALERGWGPNDLLEDAPIREGKYRPENFGHEYYGEATLTFALAKSLNTPTVRLADAVGINSVINTARSLGIEADMTPNLATALGSNGVPLLELVTAYTAIAREGETVEPFAIRKISDEQGRLLYTHSGFTGGVRAVNSASARQLADMMVKVIEGGTGYGAMLPFRAAGKTGTSQDFRDALFVGFTEDFAAGVWVGNDDNSPMKGVTGGSLPAGVWREVMQTAHDKRGRTDRMSSYGAPEAIPASDSSGGFFSMLGRLLNE